MKCLGLIGNLNDSLVGVYTQTINAEVQKELGGNHSADVRFCCIDAAKVDELLAGEDWDSIAALLVDCGRSLILAGADGLVICGSKLNPVAFEVREILKVPLIDMAYAVETVLRNHGHRRVGIVSPSTSREEKWWCDDLSRISMLHPSGLECEWLNARGADAVAGHNIEKHWIIDTRQILVGLRCRKADAVVLSSPIFNRLIIADECPLDFYDASEIHAWAAALWALNPGPQSASNCVFAG
ncbi:MAG: aspartate/glutamate racemase family protein [Opitutaceae bacterium]|nr:aspartate/glutamate racemase family protein [Opitutaceae bacterium]